MSVIGELIFDRTEDDIKNLTAKGHYNAVDLNRVGQAMQYIGNLLHNYGYSIKISPKTDWTMNDIPNQSEMNWYVHDLVALRNVIPVYTSTPTVPQHMDKLTWQKANDVEKILFDLNEIITKMEKAWFYSGDLYSGDLI